MMHRGRPEAHTVSPQLVPDTEGIPRARRPARTGLALWSLSATIVFGMVLAFIVEANNRYKTAIAEAERTATSFAEVLAEHTARTFEAIDRTLGAASVIRNEFDEGKFTQQSANQALRALWKSAPSLRAIGWTNETGEVVASSFEGTPVRANISDLEHFRAQREGRADGLFISPLFRSQASGQWISAVSRPLTDKEGRFAGIVAAPLDLNYFARIYRAVKIGPQDSLLLARDDGTVLTREPFVESAVTQSFKDTTLFSRLLKQADAGVYASKSPIDGVDRIYGYKRVAGLPLVMIVTASRDDALARWYGYLRIFVPLLLVQILVVLAGTLLLWRRTRELSSQSLLLEAALDNMHQGLIVVDQTDRIAVCNRKAMELLDLPPALMLSRPSSDDVIAYQANMGEFENLPEQTKGLVRPQLFGAVMNVYERRRANGTLLEIQTMPFATGGTVRTYTDITATRQAALMLQQSESQFRLLAENATDVIARLSFSGVLLYVSPSSLAVSGYAPDELVGMKITDFVHADDVASTISMFACVFKEDLRVKNVEYRFRHKDGRWIWLEANPTLVKDEAGAPSEFVDVVRDVTTRKLFEQEAATAREQAQKALSIQSQFLATMSHELRTPLNSIVGFSEIVLDRMDLPSEVRRQVGLIQTASDALLAVVNDVLDFAKLEEGKLDLAPTPFAVKKLVEDSVAIVRASAAAKQLLVEIEIDPEIPPVLSGDDHRLRQVLLNLLNNAIKFTPKGSVKLSVTQLKSAESGARWLRFSVTDTGIGIPENRLDRLFQRFSQVDNSTSREFGGSGLGLAISKRLIDAMDGTIGVDSRVGEGSTFWFAIRLPVSETMQVVEKPRLETVQRRSSIRLLLAEDIDVNREIACATLESMGVHVDAVVDGADAVLMAEANDYDIVLMDIQMPGMDGITAARQIRSMPEPKGSVPIIAMTANVLPTQIESFFTAGMNGHIGKPFKRSELVAAIDRCVQVHNDNDPASIDQTVTSSSVNFDAIEVLTDLIGATKIDELCGKLGQQLQAFVEGLTRPGDASDIGRQAHNLVSSAGMLGFEQVSRICAEVEGEAKAENITPALLERARSACVAALRQISFRTTQSPSATRTSEA